MRERYCSFVYFFSIVILSKEENNRKTEYQVLTSKDASKPF